MKGRGGTVASHGRWCLEGRRDGFPETGGRYEVGEVVPDVWAVVPREPPATETTAEELIAKAQHLKHILDRFIACRPTGKARTNQVVTAALHRLVKESAAMYSELTGVMSVLIDRFAMLETPACVRVHSIFTSVATLLDELDDFYSWCRFAAICPSSEIPDVEHVAQKKLDLMDNRSQRRKGKGLHVAQKKLDLMDKFIRDRQAAPAPSSPHAPIASNGGIDATKPLPAPEVKGAEPAGALVVVDDHMADFLHLDEETTPLSAEEQERNPARSLFGGDPLTPAKWEAFDDDPSDDWETARVQSASRFATQQLSAMQPPHCATTVLALPPPPGATASQATDPFAASLAVPPPTYVQMMDMQARQRLLANEQMMWQQFERQQLAAWNYSTPF
uniref:AP180 N-terminal homology (ANTH) domain-containing protein n=1 Tax=Oryza brachyantha TaxID=4533 RepID=J3L6F9_ORYBR